jgi:hypothetical protein
MTTALLQIGYKISRIAFGPCIIDVSYQNCEATSVRFLLDPPPIMSRFWREATSIALPIEIGVDPKFW